MDVNPSTNPETDDNLSNDNSEMTLLMMAQLSASL